LTLTSHDWNLELRRLVADNFNKPIFHKVLKEVEYNIVS